MPSSRLDSQYIQIPADSTANRPGSPVTGMIRYNTTTGAGEVYTPSGWGGFGSPLGTEGNPASSGSQLYSYNSAYPDGLYFFKNASGIVKQCYVDMTNGGWVLVASNNASDSTIPAGSGRQSTAYFVGRSGGSLGTASPNSDYLIGDWLDTFAFTSVRGVGFGFASTNGTYTWANKGTYVDCRFNLSTTGTNRYTELIARANVTITGNGSVDSAAAWWMMDCIRADYITGGFNANTDQTTIGIAGIQSSGGDPVNGTYYGHGSGETGGSYEGWYPGGTGASNCQGYTTWVK